MYTDEELKERIAELREMVEKLSVLPSLKRPAQSLIDQYEVVIDDTLHPLYATLTGLINGLEGEIISWNGGNCDDWKGGRLHGYLNAVSRVYHLTGRYAVRREVE